MNFEVRHLKLGDFMWIARCRNTRKEVVLPHIVERKRIDDLAQSIKDNRYHEQKVKKNLDRIILFSKTVNLFTGENEELRNSKSYLLDRNLCQQ